MSKRREVTPRRRDVPIFARCAICGEWLIGPERDHCLCDIWDAETPEMESLITEARNETMNENRTWNGVEFIVGMPMGVKAVELDPDRPISDAVHAVNVLDPRRPTPQWTARDIIITHPEGERMRVMFARSKNARYSAVHHMKEREKRK